MRIREFYWMGERVPIEILDNAGKGRIILNVQESIGIGRRREKPARIGSMWLARKVAEQIGKDPAKVTERESLHLIDEIVRTTPERIGWVWSDNGCDNLSGYVLHPDKNERIKVSK